VRKSVLHRGYFVSTGNPEDVVAGPFSILDFARLRAAKLTTKRDGSLYVWEWNPENGLRRVRAHAQGGLVYWRKPCRLCDERGCDACGHLGAVVDKDAPVERAGEGV
jgi:hypothetical protein